MNKFNIDCNNQGIIFVLTIATVYWFSYNKYFRPIDREIPHLMGKTLINLNENIKILFPYLIRGNNKLQYEDRLDYWSGGHFITYFIAGLFFPNKYFFVLIFSVLCELFEYFAGYRGRMSDLYVNLLGYYLGSIINHKKLDDVNIKFCFNKKNYIIVCIPLMLILLYLLYKLRLRNNFT
jgi:hypothetical protein